MTAVVYMVTEVVHDCTITIASRNSEIGGRFDSVQKSAAHHNAVNPKLLVHQPLEIACDVWK